MCAKYLIPWPNYKHFRFGINMAVTCKLYFRFAMWSYIWRSICALSNLSRQQISVKQLQKWNSISTLSFWSSYACQSASACQILSKSSSHWILLAWGDHHVDSIYLRAKFHANTFILERDTVKNPNLIWQQPPSCIFPKLAFRVKLPLNVDLQATCLCLVGNRPRSLNLFPVTNLRPEVIIKVLRHTYTEMTAYL